MIKKEKCYNCKRRKIETILEKDGKLYKIQFEVVGA